MQHFINNILPLQVSFPLLMGVLVFVIRNKKLSFFISIFTLLVTTIMSLVLYFVYQKYLSINYNISNWPAPWGIEYRVDSLTMIFILLTCIIALVSFVSGINIQTKESRENSFFSYNSAYLLTFSGFLGMIITADVFNLFVFLEISSLASYILIALGKDKQAYVASFNYLILGTISATFYVLGIGIIYNLTGTLNMGDLQKILPDLKIYQTSASLGISLIIFGLIFKVGVFPVTTWMTEYYKHAPTSTGAFLAGASSKVALYAFIRIVLTIVNQDQEFIYSYLANVLKIVSIFAIIFASLFAVYKSNLKQILAYSSLAQMGYILLSITILSQASFDTGIVFVVAHALTKSSLMIITGYVVYYTGAKTISELKLANKYNTLIFFSYFISALCLIGIPGTINFNAKIRLLNELLQKELYIEYCAVILGSILGIIYMFRVIEALWINESEDDDEKYKMPIMPTVIIIALVVLNVMLGLFPSLLHHISSIASEEIFGLIINRG